jgi:HlyD family secretion protein
MIRDLFRQSAMKRISSPEQLDQLPRVVGPMGWLSLLSSATIVAVAVFWGFVARIPIKVAGAGILIQSSGICEVIPLSAGQLIQVGVAVGDTVVQGQVVAYMDLPRMSEEIRQTRLTLDHLKAKRITVEQFGAENLRQQAENRTLRIKAAEVARAGRKERLRWLEERIRNQESLLSSGLIAKPTLMTSRQEFQAVQDEVRSMDSQLHQLSVEGDEQARRHQSELIVLDQQIAEAHQQLKGQQNEFQRISSVRSPWSGRVIEITALAGDFVVQGRAIMRIESLAEDVSDLSAILFVTPQEGKKARRGMKVLVYPSTVKATEYGGIYGLVTDVSDHPSSPQSIQRLLVNEQLTLMLSGEGSPFQITVSLIPDVSTYSGFDWSSGKGPMVKIQSGTLCEGQVVVDQAPPVSYVIPFFRKLILGERDPFSDEKPKKTR